VKQFLCVDHSDFVQITLKLAKDFINQIAVPVRLNKALLIKVLISVRLPRPYRTEAVLEEEKAERGP